MSPPLDLGKISTTLQRLLEQSGRPVALRDEASGQLHDIPTSLAAAPAGLLPGFLAAGEAVWRAATGRSLGVEQVHDPESLLGYRVKSVRGAPFSAVMLAIMEATERTARPDMLVVNDLGRLWRELPPYQPAAATAAQASHRVMSPAP